jgi:hypothetical protein
VIPLQPTPSQIFPYFQPEDNDIDSELTVYMPDINGRCKKLFEEYDQMLKDRLRGIVQSLESDQFDGKFQTTEPAPLVRCPKFGGKHETKN